MSSSRPDSDAPDAESSTSLAWGEQWRRSAGSNGDARVLRTSALQAAQTPSAMRTIMTGALIVLVVLGVVLLVVPWRQTVSGTGQVTAFSPDARPRTVEAQIPARVQSWRVTEGDAVTAGDTIAVLEDMSTDYMDDQFPARVAESRAGVLRDLRLEVEQARQALSQAQQKRRSAQARVQNAALGLATARTRQTRVDSLYEDGIESLRALETAQLNLRRARTDSVAAAADLEAARRAVESARLDVQRKESRLEARRAELNRQLENAQQRQDASVVRAPTDGTIARINRVGAGQTVKPGSSLALIAPTTDDRAAELFVSSIGASLVEPGERVQLQFSGFPALQFSGFPNASIGTFAGTVRFVNPVDDGTGRFRLLVVPDTSEGRPPWPTTNFLRQGASVRGSVLLSNVSLGYEIWRRMNGLPPQVSVQQQGQASAQ